jgi:hypothetical protein
MAMRKRTTVEELEALLHSEDDTSVEVLPDGSIRQSGKPAKKSILDFFGWLRKIRSGY